MCGRPTMKPMMHNKLTRCLLGSFIGLLCATPAAAKIYTCEINGDVVYTSRPSGKCQSPDLPSIGRYTSSRYDAPEMVVENNEPKAERKPAKTAKAPKKQQAAAPKKAPVIPAPAAQTAAAPKPAAPVKAASANNSRRSILEQELANERKALNEAQKSLAQARAAKGGSIDRNQVSQYESSVLDRQQNIQALQRELGRM